MMGYDILETFFERLIVKLPKIPFLLEGYMTLYFSLLHLIHVINQHDRTYYKNKKLTK